MSFGLLLVATLLSSPILAAQTGPPSAGTPDLRAHAMPSSGDPPDERGRYRSGDPSKPADSLDKPKFTRVRSMDRYIFELVMKGYERSSTFRVLVDTLQQSNAIVLIQPGRCAGGRIRSCLVSVNGSDEERHIRIRVDPQHTIEIGLIAAVAHELQHAVEITERQDIVDAAGVLRLYRRIAYGRCQQGLSEECETSQALTTERKVLLELW